jgi:hypothetical protein
MLNQSAASMNLEPVETLESLPPELLGPILQQLPVPQIVQICHLSSSLSRFCRDWTLWATLANRDFRFPRALFRQTFLTNPGQRYRQIQEYYAYPYDYLSRAAKQGRLEVVRYLLQRSHQQYDADIANVKAQGYGPDFVEWFVNDRHNRLNDALNQAAKAGQRQVVNALFEAGADDFDILRYPAYQGNLAWVCQLIQAGATGLTELNWALEMAAQAGHLNVVQELIKAGANNVDTALQLARQFHRHSVIQYLQSLSPVE